MLVTNQRVDTDTSNIVGVGPDKECEHEESHTEIFCPAEIFSNHLIFDRIVKACDLSTFKSLRLVCSASFRNSLKLWRETCVVHLSNWDSTLPGRNQLPPEELLTLITTSSSILQVSQCPYRNFKISSWNILECDGVNHFLEEYFFWKNCGPTMKYLELDRCSFTECSLFMVIALSTQNIQHLIFNRYGGTLPGIILYTDWVNESLKTLEAVGTVPFPDWGFLKQFPNLENLKLRDFSRDFLFEEIRRIRMESQYSVLNLKRVDIVETNQRHQGLLECQLPLEHLSLRLDMGISENDLCHILEQYGGKLKSLVLFRFPIFWPSFSSFSDNSFNTNFDYLTELQIWGNVISTFHFLKKMPNLRKLLMDFLCFDKHRQIRYWRSTVDKIVPFTEAMMEHEQELTEIDGLLCLRLEYFQIDFKFGVKSMQNLGKWMPNLKVLRTILTNETLSVVCKQWSKLEELKVMFGSDVDDNGIVGVEEVGDDQKMLYNQQQRGPNLTNLKELKTFELEAYCRESKLSDVSAEEAFLKMDSLTNLKICVSEKISKDSENRLKDKIKKVKLYKNNCAGPHFNDIKCCRRVAFLKRNSRI